HQGVDEKADQSFDFAAIAVGDRPPDGDVGLAGVAVEELLERRQEDHEGCRPRRGGQGPDRGGQGGPQVGGGDGAGEGLHRRPRASPAARRASSPAAAAAGRAPRSTSGTANGSSTVGGGAIICTGSSPRRPSKRVRSTSWRATSRESAKRKAG